MACRCRRRSILRVRAWSIHAMDAEPAAGRGACWSRRMMRGANRESLRRASDCPIRRVMCCGGFNCFRCRFTKGVAFWTGRIGAAFTNQGRACAENLKQAAHVVRKPGRFRICRRCHRVERVRVIVSRHKKKTSKPWGCFDVRVLPKVRGGFATALEIMVI